MKLASDNRTAELELKNHKLDDENAELRQLMLNNEKQINELKSSVTTSSHLAEENIQLEDQKKGTCEATTSHYFEIYIC